MRDITGISFQNIHPCPSGFRVNTAVYAHDEGAMMVHVSAWIRHILKVLPAQMFVWNTFLVFSKAPDYRGIADRLEAVIGERLINREDDPVDAIMLSNAAE